MRIEPTAAGRAAAPIEPRAGHIWVHGQGKLVGLATTLNGLVTTLNGPVTSLNGPVTSAADRALLARALGGAGSAGALGAARGSPHPRARLPVRQLRGSPVRQPLGNPEPAATSRSDLRPLPPAGVVALRLGRPGRRVLTAARAGAAPLRSRPPVLRLGPGRALSSGAGALVPRPPPGRPREHLLQQRGEVLLRTGLP